MITWYEVFICAVLAVTLGGSGFGLGCMIATDHADRRHADELAARLERRQARRVPLADQIHRPPRVPLAAPALEADTTPLRAIPAALVALGGAAARFLGRPPDPGFLEADLALDAHRAELEIYDMIRNAEAAVGRLGVPVAHDV